MFGMKKVVIKYISHIFQNEHIEKIELEENGYVEESEGKVTLNFTSAGENKKVNNSFIFEESQITIIRDLSILKFGLNERYKCKYETEYGSLMLETKLKKYLKLGNEFVINYELNIDNESIGSYVVRVSYKEMS